jgi:hypothetical protein
MGIGAAGGGGARGGGGGGGAAALAPRRPVVTDRVEQTEPPLRFRCFAARLMERKRDAENERERDGGREGLAIHG